MFNTEALAKLLTSYDSLNRTRPGHSFSGPEVEKLVIFLADHESDFVTAEQAESRPAEVWYAYDPDNGTVATSKKKNALVQDWQTTFGIKTDDRTLAKFRPPNLPEGEAAKPGQVAYQYSAPGGLGVVRRLIVIHGDYMDDHDPDMAKTIRDLASQNDQASDQDTSDQEGDDQE